jgi:hypothetical protein
LFEFDSASASFPVGSSFGKGQNRKRILEVRPLSNGWILLKTEDSKTPHDFRVRTIYQTAPTVRSLTPKHAHFAIDFFGKIREDGVRGTEVFQAILDVWKGEEVEVVLAERGPKTRGSWGYSLEYILYALKWILEQEDVNFKGRPKEKQSEIQATLRRSGIEPLPSRVGSQLAISLFCNISQGVHPIDALMRANLDIIPAKRAKGTR